jgi:hypothetical protein
MTLERLVLHSYAERGKDKVLKGQDMPIDYPSVSLNSVFRAFKFVAPFYKKLINYLKRPKLKLSVSNTSIEFLTNTGQIQHPNFLSIVIENVESTDIHLDLNKAFINGESLGYIIQVNPYYSSTREVAIKENEFSTKNTLLNLFRENWTTSKFKKIAPH